MKKWKFETKVYTVAVLVPLVATLLALAPFPQGIKIIGDLVFQEQAAVVTTPVAGTGTFYVKNTTPSTPIFVNDAGAETTLGAAGSGGVAGPGTSTDRAIPTYNGTAGDTLRDSTVVIDSSGNVALATGDTVDGRDVGNDGAKLDGIEAGADDNPTDAEIETAYNNQVSIMSQAEAEAGVATTRRGITAERMAQAIAAQAGSGGDPTYGSDAGAADDTVYVSDDNWLGLGITSPLGPLHIYSESAAPRTYYDYFNDTDAPVTQYPTNAATVDDADVATPAWATPSNVYSDNGAPSTIVRIGTTTEYSEALTTDTYGFAIPSGATILGVEVDVEGSMSDADVTEGHAYLIRGGTIATGVDRSTAANWGGSMGVHTYGGPTDDWGGITAAEINASNFGFAFYALFTHGSTISIDYITITVYYESGITGDWLWSSGTDTSDGTFTLRANATDQMRMDYTTGATAFTGVVDADGYKQDGVLYDLSTFGTGGGDVNGPVSSTDNAIARWNGTGGDTVQDSVITIADTTGNMAGVGTLNTHTIPGGTDTFTLLAAAQTLTNKRVQVHYALDNSTPVDLAYGTDQAMVTELAANTTINAPTGTPLFGEKLLYSIKQNASSPYTVTWNGVFVSGTDWALSGAIPAQSTALGAWDYYLFMWNNATSEWHLLACSQGN